MTASSIAFPHLGIVLKHVGQSVRLFGVDIAFYGIIIAGAMLAGILLAEHIARRTGQDPDMYFEFALIAIVVSVIGARVYYVIFSWEYYGEHPEQILNLRGGGLAIYGGVIAGILTAWVYSRLRRVNLLLLLDTAMPALLLGQIIGRWGNFFNREAFGEYTDGLLAMRLPLASVNTSDVTQAMLDHMVTLDGIECIQVHPTFLYESLWNIGVLLVLLAVTYGGSKTNHTQHRSFFLRKRYDGEVFLLYLSGYGLGRLWIEGLRTDQLLLPGTDLAVSQILSGGMVCISLIILFFCNKKFR